MESPSAGLLLSLLSLAATSAACASDDDARASGAAGAMSAPTSGGSPAAPQRVVESNAANGDGGSGGGGGDVWSHAAEMAGTSAGSPACDLAFEYELSSAIPTVGIVTWRTSTAVTSAVIEFWLVGASDVMVAPVDLEAQDHRTLLLGMKQERDYAFHIVAQTGSGVCVSEEYTLTTGALPDAPSVTRGGAGGGSRGFILTTTGISGTSGEQLPAAYIFDTDGDVVWSTAAPSSASRAHMSWGGEEMWVEALNVNGTMASGEMRRVSMDGLVVEPDVSGLAAAHHDFTVTPEGLAVIVYTSSRCSGIIERSWSGEISSVVADVSTIYTPIGYCHTNYIRYYPSDDTYSIADRYPNLFVKLERNGNLLWQFGGTDPKGPTYRLDESWQVNHGHDLGEDGRFVFFNNTTDSTATVMEFQLDEARMTASKLWSYTPGARSASLGDVQRLPGGNYLITFSNSGAIHEIDGTQHIVKSFTSSSFGYAEFRQTLYGPPLHY